MKKVILISVAAIFALGSQSAMAEFSDNIGVGVKAGTLGAGLEFNYGFNETFSATFGVNTYGTSFNEVSGGINYDVSIGLQTIELLGNYHPFDGSFRLTSGVLFNDNEIAIKGTSDDGSYTIGSGSYTPDELNGLVTFDDAAPYFGIGWGHEFNNNWGLIADLGFMYQGEAEVALTATGTASTQPGFEENLEKERVQLENDLSGFKYFPVLSLGLYMRF